MRPGPLNQRDVLGLRANPRFLLQSLLQRGAELFLVDFQEEVVRATLGGSTEDIIHIHSRHVPKTSAYIADDKYLAKEILFHAGISVPRGLRFMVDDVNDAFFYGRSL